MRSILGPLAAVILFAAGSLVQVTAAMAQSGSSAEGAPSAEEGDDAFSRYFDLLADDRFEDALATVSQIQVDDDNRRGRAILAVMRGTALLGLKRDAEAMRQFADAEKLAPDSTDVVMLAFNTALTADRFDFAATYFDRLVAGAPDLVREMAPETVWFLLRNEPKGQERQNDDRRVALARLGYGGEDGDYLAGDAVEILVKRGDVSGASELLKRIDDPQQVENLLIQKKVSPIWPQVEAMAGPSLEKVRSAAADSAEKAFVAAPRDFEKLQQLANALRHAGRYEELVALRSRLPFTSEAMAEVEEQMGWAINNVALGFNEIGMRDEADELFKLLNEARMEKGQWRVSMKINRLELLVTDGRFDRALPLLDATEASAKNEGNAYAQQLVRRLRYCTMSGLGRKDEAVGLLPDLLKHAEDAPGPTIDGLICGGELDEAEKLALASLKKSTFETDFLRSLQARPLTSDDPSVWSRGWSALRQRPAIAREFDRLGRDMPDHLLPPPPPTLAAAN